MTLDAWLTLAILVALFVMLIKTRLPAWIIFLGALTVALTLGLAPEEELLKGFSNSGVITGCCRDVRHRRHYPGGRQAGWVSALPETGAASYFAAGGHWQRLSQQHPAGGDDDSRHPRPGPHG